MVEWSRCVRSAGLVADVLGSTLDALLDVEVVLHITQTDDQSRFKYMDSCRAGQAWKCKAYRP
jgi:hypothetical protein